MRYRVRLTESAEADFEKRLTALAERSPETARKLHAKYLTALRRLSDFPLSCGLVHEHAAFPETLRHLLFSLQAIPASAHGTVCARREIATAD
jgi:plasmid stabilization system protein ParE